MWVCGALVRPGCGTQPWCRKGWDTQLSILSGANKLEGMLQNGANQISKYEVRKRSYVLFLLVPPCLERVTAGSYLSGRHCKTGSSSYIV